MTGAVWSQAKSKVSPCPTLRVIGTIQSVLDKREEKQVEENLRLAREKARANIEVESALA